MATRTHWRWLLKYSTNSIGTMPNNCHFLLLLMISKYSNQVQQLPDDTHEELSEDNLRKRCIVLVSWCCMRKRDGEIVDHLLIQCPLA